MYLKFLKHTSNQTRKPKVLLIIDSIFSALMYKVSLLEYFQFRFFGLKRRERLTYAGTGFMYEYQRRMNPKGTRAVLSDKFSFLKRYGKFIKHGYCSVEEFQADDVNARTFISNNIPKLVLKNSQGQCGRGIEIVDFVKTSKSEIVKIANETGNDLIEEFVVQHPDLMKLSPSGLNTIRLVTQIDEHDKVKIIAARIRITISSIVDNLAAGNVAAPLDLVTGKVTGPAVYSDITKDDIHVHPVTGTKIVGFEVPHWDSILNMIERAARLDIRNRSIGWDIAVTSSGPDLIEGNHDWCKLLWQLPVKNGLKQDLETFLS